MRIVTVFLLFFAPSFDYGLILAHEAHRKPEPPATTVKQNKDLDLITQGYTKDIKPIFSKKCFDCHSNKTVYPWYYKVPGIKQLINYDIREAQEHMDMSEGYPFTGHHSTLEQLESMIKVIEKDEMPIWRYRLLHPESKLTSQEKKSILIWARQSFELLEKNQINKGVKHNDH